MNPADRNSDEKMPDRTVDDRCRLVICMGSSLAPALRDDGASFEWMHAGDIASIILYDDGSPSGDFQTFCEQIVDHAQPLGIAVIVCGDTQVAGRAKADGYQTGQDIVALRDAMERFSPQMMVGAGNVKSRHTALSLGELQPDYLMFGAPGGDTRDEPNPKNVELARWWAAMVEIPCIALGGRAPESVIEIAGTGAEFVALEAAIFRPSDGSIDIEGATERVRRANEMLDRDAPKFEYVE